MDIHNIIKRPIITEKSMDDAKLGKFTFEVERHADKPKIKKAIEEQFKVNVLDVAVAIVKGKKRRHGQRRMEVVRTPWKKAIIKLARDQKIDLFDVSTA